MDGGEFPTIHMPKTVVILIGTNDLTYADCHDDQMEILNAARGVIDRCASRSALSHRHLPALHTPALFTLISTYLGGHATVHRQ